MTVRNLRGHFCPVCDEGVWDSESNRRLDEAQTELIGAVGKEASADIRRIRKALKLSQAQLAAHIGLGPLALSRYERGKTQPPPSLLTLLRLLEKHPELWEEVRRKDLPDKRPLTLSRTATPRKRVGDREYVT